jgi:hypothetical protein
VLAALSPTHYAAIWTDTDSAGGDEGIAMSLLDTASGAGPVVHANSITTASEEAPDAIALAGQLVVAWTDWSNPGTAPDLAVRTFDGSLSPTSAETFLAASAEAETDIALAPFNATWAAAWRSASNGMETIHVKSGSVEAVIGPLLGGPMGERPTLVQVGPTSLFVGFTVTVDDTAGNAVSTALEGSVVDMSSGTASAPQPLSLAALPSGGGAALAQASPAAIAVGSTLWLSAWTAAQPGDPLGEDLWLTSAATTSPSSLGASVLPLPRIKAHRAGDQRAPALAAMTAGANGTLVAAWEDYGGSLGTNEGQPEVVLQVIPLPVARASP